MPVENPIFTGNFEGMKKFVVLFFLVYINMHAQITFQKTFGRVGSDFGYSIEQTIDGGYIIGGSSVPDTSQSIPDMCLIKLNASADTMWTKSYGGPASDVGQFAGQTLDGGYMIIGLTTSFGAGSSDMYVVKTNANGDTSWTRAIGGVSDELGQFIIQTNDSGYVITGHTDTYGEGHGDVGLFKLDKNGNMLWSKTYGGTQHDHGYCVRQTNDGGFIVIGHTLSFGESSGGFYTIRTDSLGEVIWSRVYGGTSDGYCYAVLETTDGGFIIGGYNSSFGAGGNDVYIVKTTSTGDTLWTKTYGGAGEETSNAILPTSDGNYLITGTTSSFGAGAEDIYLLKITPTGSLLWSKAYGGPYTENGFYASETSDGGYMLVGISNSFSTNGDFDVYIIKTDSLGETSCLESPAATIVTSPTAVADTAATIKMDVNPIAVSTAAITTSGMMQYDPCLIAGISGKNNTDEQFVIFPNPSNGNLTVKMPGTGGSSVEMVVYNMLGEMVYHSIEENEQTDFRKELQLNNSAAGIYVVRLITNGKTYSTKLTICNTY